VHGLLQQVSVAALQHVIARKESEQLEVEAAAHGGWEHAPRTVAGTIGFWGAMQVGHCSVSVSTRAGAAPHWLQHEDTVVEQQAREAGGGQLDSTGAMSALTRSRLQTLQHEDWVGAVLGAQQGRSFTAMVQLGSWSRPIFMSPILETGGGAVHVFCGLQHALVCWAWQHVLMRTISGHCSVSAAVSAFSSRKVAQPMLQHVWAGLEQHTEVERRWHSSGLYSGST